MDNRQRLDLLTKHARRFDTAMLVTAAGAALPNKRARPMTLARIDDDGTTWFPVSASSGIAEEIAADPEVAVVLQDDDCFVSLSGTARLSGDPGLIQQLWSPTWRTWFEEGMKDPDLRVLGVTPHLGELWNRKDDSRLELLWQAARSALGDDGARETPEHAQVTM